MQLIRSAILGLAAISLNKPNKYKDLPMSMKSFCSVLLMALLLCSGQAFAKSFDISKKRSNVFGYNYIEGGYVTTNNSQNEFDANGFFIDGSFDVDKNWNIFGGYQSLSGDNYETTNMHAGFGHHFKWYFTKKRNTHYLLKNLDVMALAGVEQVETEFTINLPVLGNQTVTDSETGGFAGVRARKLMVPNLEVALSHVAHSYGDGIFTFTVEALYEVAKGLHLRAASEHYDNDLFVNFFDDDTLSVGVRYNF